MINEHGRVGLPAWLRLLTLAVLINIASLAGSFLKMPTVAAEAPGVITSYSVSSNSFPYGIVKGPDGNMWVSEAESSKIDKIIPSGDITQYPLPQNSTPTDIIDGPDGNLWFTMTGSVGKMTTSGALTQYALPSGTQPLGLTVGPDSAIWIASGNSDVYRMNEDGTYTTIKRQISQPSGGIVVGPSTSAEYVTSDPASNAVWVSAYSQYISKITMDGTETDYALPSELTGVRTSTLGPDGNIYFTSSGINGDGYVSKMTPAGVFTTHDLGPGHELWYIRVGADGNFWATDNTAGQIAKIAPGTLETTFYGSGLSFPLGMASGPDGNMWFTEAFGDKVDKISENATGGTPALSQQAIQQLHRESQSSPNTVTHAEPINMIGGNYLTSRQEFSITGRDLPVSFYASYDSNSATQSSALGYGWTHSYLVSVAPQTDGTVLVANEDGRIDQYTPNGSGGYTPPLDIHDSLAKTANGWQLIRRNHDIFNFNTNGQLISITSPNGNAQTLAYNSQNELTTLTDTVGRVFNLSYDGNAHLTQVTDPSGRSVAYSYDDNGNLATATDPNGGVTKYHYDANHHITSITDPRGTTAVTNTYDAQGRVTSQQNALGATVTLDYAPGQTTFTDAKGVKMIYSYDSQLRRTKTQNGSGGTTTYAYDANSNPNVVTDPNGHTTTMVYDNNGNLTQKTDANGGTTTYTYDANNNLVSLVDPLGHTTSYTYDAKNNVTSKTDAAGSKTTYAYDSYGALISATDPTGAITKLGYDAQANATSVTDPVGNVTHIAYDNIGRPISATSATNQTTAYTYDALNRLLQKKDPLGDTTTYAYDADSNKTKLTDPNGHATSYTYDVANELTQVTDALGHTTNYAYDANGNLASTTDANNHTTTYSYDVLNQLVTTTNPLGQKTSQTHDANGNVISSTDPKGQVTTYAYNPLGQLTAATYADHSSTNYAYDADGNRTQMSDSTGATTYAYDVLGNLIKVTSPGNKTVSYTYNANSAKTSMAYPDGQTESYAYNPAGELTTATDSNKQSTAYTYDQTGKVTGVKYPNGAGISYAYDNAGRLTNITNTVKYGLSMAYAYTLDASGNRTSVTQTLGSSTLSLPLQNSGSTTNYTYDALNRLTNAQGAVSNQSFTYDPVGNRLTQTANGFTTKYAYDAADELTRAGTTTYAYDANGNRTQQKSDGFVTTNYAYNAANELTTIANPFSTLDQYTYNGDGNRVQTTAGFSTTNNVWNVNNGIPQILSQTTLDQTTDYQYGNSLIGSTGQLPYSQSYEEYDGLGSVVGTTNSAGMVATQNAYDAYGNTQYGVSVLGSQSSFGYAGQQQDSSGLINMRARYYDPTTGTFLARDTYPASQTNPMTLNRYAYVLDNPTNLIDPTGLWPSWGTSLGLISAGFGTAALVASLVPGVGTGVAAGLESISLVTGLAATVLDCKASQYLQCGLDVAATTLGGAGVGFRVAGLLGKVSEDTAKVVDTVLSVDTQFLSYSAAGVGVYDDSKRSASYSTSTCPY